MKYNNYIAANNIALKNPHKMPQDETMISTVN